MKYVNEMRSSRNGAVVSDGTQRDSSGTHLEKVCVSLL